jgi:hypothetical protein
MAVIYRPLAPFAYFDESGKWKDKDFICLCGYLSGERAWGKLNDEWTRLLVKKELYSVRLAKYFYQCRKKGWDDTQIAETLAAFIGIIRKRVWVGFGIGFDAKHYRKMPAEAKKALGDPAMVCLHRLLKLIRNKLRETEYEGRMAITFDEDAEYVEVTYKATQRLRSRDKGLGRLIGALSFADDEFLTPLQAADILANLTNRWFRDRMDGSATEDNPSDPLKSLLLAPNGREGLEYCTELWDADALDRNWRKLVPPSDKKSK